MSKQRKSNGFIMSKSSTNSGLLNFFEKIIRSHPLLYVFARYFVRHTNIFEEDATGVKYINFKDSINIIDVGASDGIASKFFLNNLNVNKAICFEPSNFYIKILKKIKNNKLIIKPYAIGHKKDIKEIYFPRYKLFDINLDLIPYTYYNKLTLSKQLELDFKFRKNIQIIKQKLKINKIKKLKYKIDLIKIDVNDNGLSVVKCLEKIIKKDQPALLIETDSDIKKIIKILRKYKYEKYAFSNKKNKFEKIYSNFPLNTYFLKDKHFY